LTYFRKSRIWPVNPERIAVSAFPAKAGRKFNSWKAWQEEVKMGQFFSKSICVALAAIQSRRKTR
jgi:hypothetical protein